jgi:Ca-activated chloride channel family protein
MRYLLSVLVLGLLLAAPAQSLIATAAVTVAGIVEDAAGVPIANASVELHAGQQIAARTTTDNRGRFTFVSVAPGIYVIRATTHLGAIARAVDVSDRPLAELRLVAGTTSERHAEAQQAPLVRDSAATAAGVSSEIRALPPPASLPHSANPASALHYRGHAPGESAEAYARIDESQFRRAADSPRSTFSIDVDTASYSNVRRFLRNGQAPPPDAVRIEELLNYFRFDYPVPDGSHPFSVTAEVGAAPWAPSHRLVLVGLRARPVDVEDGPARNLVFLLDVSGSMASPDKLPLVKAGMRMLTSTLTPRDRVAIVVYAGTSGVALPTTSGRERARIDRAIAELQAGGSTNGAAGIRLAYDLAARAFVPGGVNRVILATDGDFNVGVTSEGELTRLIEQQRERGIFLSVLGVGTGNLKDSTMEQLANRGNGNYAYLDSAQEARRVLVDEAAGTLVTVAKDVKIQVEFNPARVGAYRLIGYENRLLADHEFNDDTRDAGEMGSGHTVTALYEVIPVGRPLPGVGAEPLRYQRSSPTDLASARELLTIAVRYKTPDGDVSRLLTRSVVDRSGALTSNLGFAAAVVEFGMLLRGSELAGHASWTEAASLARRFRGPDEDGYRAEFLELIALAAAADSSRPRRDGPHPQREWNEGF